MMLNNNNNKNNNLPKQANEDPKSMKTFKSKSATWAMAVGLTTTSLLKSKPDSTDPQKSSSAETTTPQQMSGVLLVLSLRW